jgi:hypothetical protein
MRYEMFLEFVILMALAINGFFLKSIMASISSIKVSIATMLADSKHVKVEIDRIDEEIKSLRIKMHDIANEYQVIRAKLDLLERQK